MNKKIAITGEGIVSAIGLNKQTVLESLRKGVSGIQKMKYLDSVHKELPVGEVKLTNDEMKDMLGLSHDKLLSRTSLMGILSVKQAIEEAKIKLTAEKKLRIFLVSGTTVGGMDITERYYENIKVSDRYLGCIKEHDCGSCTATIADFFGLFDDYTTISTACSSAANAIILGANLIKEDKADIVIAGGTEALSIFHLNGFNSLMILDKEKCRPFDEDRAGLNLGEGAGFIVLENEESAIERNVPIHAYLSGYGNACDAYHQTASSENGDGAFMAMSEALTMANLSPDSIQYVNAHGTGTSNNDISESHALMRLFGSNMPYISSTKSYTGHTTSASGGIEAIICVLSLMNKFIPGNLGWKKQMVDGITPTVGVDYIPLSHVMCNSFGFGGNDSSLLFTLNGVCIHPFKTNDDVDIKIAACVEINDFDEIAETKEYINPMEARRMGKLLKASLLTSLKAMKSAGVTTPDAIITATSLGCLENSEKILNQLVEEGESMLKPTYFMQSTHNTLSSNIAIHTKCHGYNVTYTQGDRSLEWAMKDAELLLKSGKYKTILVGCHDESTELYNEFLRRAGSPEHKIIHSISMIVTCGK